MATKADTLKRELLDKIGDLQGELEDKAMYVNDAELLKHIDEILAYKTKIEDAEADTPFWAKEYELLKARKDLEWNCEQAKTLQDAVICGANMTLLIDEEIDDYERQAVGYVDEDGTFELYGEFDGRKLDIIPVEFYSLDRDDDGYTTAIFRRLPEYACIACGKKLDEPDTSYCDKCWADEQKRLNNNEEK